MNYLNTFIYSEKKTIRILRHVLFWVADIINWLLAISVGGIAIREVYVFFLSIPWVILTTYFIVYYLLPKFSTGHDKSKLFLWVLISLIGLGFVLRLYKFYVLIPLIDPTWQINFNPWSAGLIIREIFSWLAVISMAVAIKLVKNKTELQEKNNQLANEKREAEVNFLKAQMHPHFLFNTLNTLYSDAIKTNSKSEQIVLRLSSLMRFMLEECNKPLILLSQEIKVIEDYLELEKLRHGSRLQIDWQNSSGNGEMLISPLLLLPFVENSCKHTLSSQRGIIQIKIQINADKDFVSLRVENDHTKQRHLNGALHGIGIKNVKKQLELLYEKNFTLDIQEDDKYIVNLKIPTSNGHE